MLFGRAQRMEGGAPLLRAGSNGGDVGGDYAFAKYNKKIELLEYNDAEWTVLKLGADPEWSRAETDYLFDLCRQFDLRFVVIADRYNFVPPALPAADAAQGAGPAPPAAEPKQRSVHELKARYFGIARRLVQSRADAAEEIARHPVMATPVRPATRNHSLSIKV
jgi:DNA methyltransferase 1-associated protein 1